MRMALMERSRDGNVALEAAAVRSGDEAGG
ncbi:hypothetical protein ARNL5_02867 [Anaerolineae bacterium]|nr:hypothetical protein ARNL5_02867 [Anaerolineae bacterium]